MVLDIEKSLKATIMARVAVLAASVWMLVGASEAETQSCDLEPHEPPARLPREIALLQRATRRSDAAAKVESMPMALISGSQSESNSIGHLASLSPEGFVQVQETASEHEMEAFLHRLLGVLGLRVKDAEEFRRVAASYVQRRSDGHAMHSFASLLAQKLAGAAPHKQAGPLSFTSKAALYNEMLDFMTDMELGPGTSASLDDEGYQAVSSLKDPQQMEFFIRRLISQVGLRVRDQGGLRGVLGFYDGETTTQSFEALQDELKKVGESSGGWVTDQVSGASASLDQDGYSKVAVLANNREMAEFVRRVVSDLGLSVEDEGGLQGLAMWHSGDKAVQTFGDLEGEVINASKINNSWVGRSKPCPGTGHPSDDELNKLQENSSWAGSPDDAPVSEEPKKDIRMATAPQAAVTEESKTTASDESRDSAPKEQKAASNDDKSSKEQSEAAVTEESKTAASDESRDAAPKEQKAASNDDKSSKEQSEAVAAKAVAPASETVAAKAAAPASETVAEKAVVPASETVAKKAVDLASETAAEKSVAPASETVAAKAVTPASEAVAAEAVAPASEAVAESAVATGGKQTAKQLEVDGAAAAAGADGSNSADGDWSQISDGIKAAR